MVGHDGFLSFTGTVLSGLGTTLNGISTLYALSHPHLSSDIVALLSSTATGVWVAAKAGVAILIDHGMATMGLGGGCISISLGLFHFLRSLAKIDGSTPPRHAPDMLEDPEEVKNFPTPQWLNRRVLNWAVVGRVGAGKSSLINALRKLQPGASEAAAVGVGHTTKRPKPYSFTGELAALAKNMARLWDLPGAGSKEWPSESYVRDAGLRHFDGVLLVVAGAFSDAEEVLLKQLEDFKVPCYVVRNKVDQDTENDRQDNGRCAEETLAEIRAELLEYGCNRDRIFLVSAKHPELSEFDFQHLLHTMADDVSMQRNDLPEFAEDASCSNQDQIFQDAQSEPFGLGDMPMPHFGGA